MLRHAVRRAAATARALRAPAHPAAAPLAPARWSVPSATRPAARRTFTGGTGGTVPSSASEQARYLRDLNRNDPEAVVRLYEQGKVVASEGNLAEYLKVRVRGRPRLDRARTSRSPAWLNKFALPVRSADLPSLPPPPQALVRSEKLNESALLRTLQRGASGEAAAGGGVENAARAMGAAALVNGEVLGTAQSPLYTQQLEPTFRAQLWRTLRTLGTAFIILSGVGALADERGGISRGIMGGDGAPKPTPETKTKFADVKGVDEAKGELVEIVEYLRSPAKFTRLGGKLPKGLLLVGPPGTGKTMLARAVAGEAGVPFFYTSGSEFEEMFVGVGARRVRDLFRAAKAAAPCIVFIDEIDAVGSARNPKDQQNTRMTLNQLLTELDGFKKNEGVIVLAATNTPESLDKALVRPGRFDRTVAVPNPDVDGRKQILETHAEGVTLSPAVDWDVIARGTPGFSGADLANLVNVAALRAALDGAQKVGMKQLEYAKDRILMGAERKSAVVAEENRRLTAYHEGGHALVALFTAGARPVHKATIVPRGQSLGMVMQLPGEG